MKKRLSLRIISFILSVILIVSAAPLSVFAATYETKRTSVTNNIAFYSWTEYPGALYYNVRAKKIANGTETEAGSLWEVKSTSAALTLEVGSYRVYVDAKTPSGSLVKYSDDYVTISVSDPKTTVQVDNANVTMSWTTCSGAHHFRARIYSERLWSTTEPVYYSGDVTEQSVTTELPAGNYAALLEVFDSSNKFITYGTATLFSVTHTHEFIEEIERKEATFTESGYVITRCSCGKTKQDRIPSTQEKNNIEFKTYEDATRFAAQQYVLPVAKSCVYNNTLYVRFDKPVYGYNCFGSKFLYAEMLNKDIIETTRELVKGGPKGGYIVGGQKKSGNWYHIFQNTIIPNELLSWDAGEPNNSGGNETMLSLVTSNGLFNDIYYEAQTVGFIVAIGLDDLKPDNEKVFSTNKYAYYEMKYPYSYAQTFCEAKGGYLATISSKAENDSIFSLVSNKERVYLGGKRNASGNFEWVNGESFTYTNWYPGEPNNGAGAGQYFMQTYTNGQWDDANDLYAENKSNQVGFVCEYEPSRIFAKLNQDNTHGITDDEIQIIAEYPDKTTADITDICDIDYHYNKGNVVVHATATKPNGEEIEVTDSLAVNKGNHRFEDGETTPATCTEDGASRVVCSICGKVITTAIKAKGHKIQEEIVEPTCTQTGLKTNYCTVCGKTDTEVIPATGHKCNTPKTVEPTATTRGYTLEKCENCSEEFKSDFTMPSATQTKQITLNQKNTFSLSAEDEFASIHFTSNKAQELYVVKESKNCGASSIRIYDEDYRLIKLSDSTAFKQAFEANKGYIIVTGYMPSRAGNATINLSVLENESEIVQDTVNLKMNVENNTLRITGTGDVTDLTAADVYGDFVESVIIDADITGIATEELARFKSLSMVQFKGANTEVTGSAQCLKNVTFSAYTSSKAQLYALANDLQFSPISGYTYTFDANGGKINNQSSFIISNKFLTGKTLDDFVPVKNNYKFIGWSLDNNPEFILTTLPEEQRDLTLKAVWNSDSNNVFADDITAIAGEQITIPVKIENNTGFMGCKLDIAYSHENLIPVSVTAGDVLTGGIEDNIDGDAKPGKFSVYWAGNQNVNADGVLFNITFNVKKSAQGSEALALSFSGEDTFDENFNDVLFDCRDIQVTYHNTVAASLPILKFKLHENAPIYVGDTFAVDITLQNAGNALTDSLALNYDHEKFEIVEFMPASGVNATVENDVLNLNAVSKDISDIGTIVLKARSKDSVGENTLSVAEGITALGGAVTFDISPLAAFNDITVRGTVSKPDKDGNFKVKIDFADNGGIMGYKLKFHYDSALVKPVYVTNGAKFSDGNLTDNIGMKDGEFVVAWQNAFNTIGDGEAFTLNFKKVTEEAVDTALQTSYSVEDTFNEDWQDVTMITEDIPLLLNDATPLINVYGGEDGCVNAEAGKTVTVPISIKDNPGLMGLKLTFDYNAENLTPVSVSSGNVFTGGLQDNIDGDAVPGSFNVYWAGSSNVSDNGVLFYVTFDVSDEAYGEEDIKISYSQEDTFDENFNDVVLKCQNIAVTYQNSTTEHTPLFKLERTETTSVVAGDSFAVNVSLTNVPEQVDSNFGLQYDNTRFEICEFVPASGVNASITENTLHVQASGLSGTAAIGQIVFKAKGVYGSENNTIILNNNADNSILGNKLVLDVLEAPVQNKVTVTGTVTDRDSEGNFKVKLNFADNAGIMGYKLRLRYDASAIQPISAQNGTLFKDGTLTTNIGSTAGEFVVVWQHSQDVKGDGEALILGFKALETDATATTLEISYSQEDTFNENYEDVILDCEDVTIPLNCTNHNYTIVSQRAADCVNAGEIVYRCTICSYEYTETIPALGHTPVTLEAKAPTCTETGLTEGSKCSVCGEILVAQQVVNALGHQYTEQITKPATCEEAGEKTFTCSRCHDTYKESITALGHNWGEWSVTVPATCTSEGVETRVCSKDSEHVQTRPIEKLAHTPLTLEAKAPTCTETGLTEGSKCSVCGEILVAQQEVAALGHKPVTLEAVAPTCTETGLTEGSKCSVCGEILVAQQEVAALGHKVVTLEAVAPTCTETGLTEGSKCSVCGEILVAQQEVAALGHKPVTLEAVAPTCTETGLTEGSKCSVCGEILVAQQVVNALGHQYTEQITKPATCEEAGEKTFTCSRCHDTYKESITALGHNWGEWSVTVPATCMSEGVETRVCSRDSEHIQTRPIEKMAHTPLTLEAKAPTCTETGLTEGSKCSVCGEVLVAQQEVAALGHKVVTLEAKAPTCTETGLTEGSKCSVCGEILVAQQVVKALGHNYVETITKPATCEEAGEKTFTCSRCHDTYKESITALGHDWGSWNTLVEPTCAKEGLKIRVCKNDVSHIEREPIEKLAHTPVTLEAKAPTCTETGLTEGSKCSVCGEILVAQQVVNALGHDYTKKVISQEALRSPKTDEAPATYYYTCSRCGEIEHNDAHFFADNALICVKLQLETVIGRQAALTLSKDGKQFIATAQNGIFAFTDLEPGTYRVYADAHNGVRVKVQNIELLAKDYGKTIALEKRLYRLAM